MFIDLIAFAVQYVPIGMGTVGSVSKPAGFGSNFQIMVGSASGPGSTFKAFLGSARVRVPLSNKIRVRVGSVQHIYGSLRVRVRIFGPVKTSTRQFLKAEEFQRNSVILTGNTTKNIVTCSASILHVVKDSLALYLSLRVRVCVCLTHTHTHTHVCVWDKRRELCAFTLEFTVRQIQLHCASIQMNWKIKF